MATAEKPKTRSCRECGATILASLKFCKPSEGRNCKRSWDARVKRLKREEISEKAKKAETTVSALEAGQEFYELRKTECNRIAREGGTSIRQLLMAHGISLENYYKILKNGFRELRPKRTGKAGGTKEKLEAAGLLEAMMIGVAPKPVKEEVASGE